MTGSAFGAALPTVSVVSADAMDGKQADARTMASAAAYGARNSFAGMASSNLVF
jgi:hypothetical protein